MATAREESNPYGGLGAGGKFRKKPYRRPQSTPYDRPPIRNPTIIPGSDGNGWLRKLMDPAHKLLATTAQKFYTTVFRKRLTQPTPPPPPPPQPTDSKQEAGEKHEGTISLNIAKEQDGASNGNQKQNLGSGSGEGSPMDLEEILKQKTFSRSEIDRLTALLHTRVVDSSVEMEEKTPEVPSKSGLFSEKKELVANIPLHDIGSGSRRISSNAVSSSVLDEDVASPAELAKAYMSSRPSKVSPSMLGLRSQALAEDSTVLTSLVHSSKSPILSLVPSSSGHVGVRENGYATPRSRGRSAIYSMARTPYTRVHMISTLKSPGPMTDGYAAPSSTQASERNRISGSSKALKRSSSIFENDIGTGGPIRRIRQKPNLSYQKNWSMPISVAGEPSSSAQKMQSVNERKLNVAEQSNMAPTSSKSTEMASRILQQLDKIVTPPKERSSELKLAVAKEKAPAKLSPSKLRGQALKSLEHIDSSKFLEFARDNDKPDISVSAFSHGSGKNSKGKDKIEQNGPSNISAASDELSPPVNGLDTPVFGKGYTVPTSRTGDSNLANSLAHTPVRKRAFKMSAHEDYLDLEEDDYSNGLSSSFVEVREKQDTITMEHKPSATQATIISEKCHSVTEDKSSTMFFAKEMADQGVNGKQAVAQTLADFSFSSVPAASPSSRPDLLAVSPTSESDITALSKESIASTPLFSSDDKAGLQKDQNDPAPTFGFASNSKFTSSNADKPPQLKFGTASFGELSSQNTPLDSGAENSSSAISVAGGLCSSTTKVPESGTAGDEKPLKDGAFSGVPGASVSTISSATFLFGIKSANSSNGPTVSAPISAEMNAVMSHKPSSIPSFPVSFSGNNSSSSLATTVSATTSSPALPSFGFGSSPSNVVSQAPSPTALPSEEAKTKKDMGPGIITGSPLVAANSSLGRSSSIFGFGGASATSNGNNQKEGSASTGAANGPPAIAESQAAGTGLASFIESVPVQFGLSSSAGLSSTAAAAPSSCSLFGSSSGANLFSSGTPFGLGTVSSSEPRSLSSNSSGSFGQASSAPAFASSLSSKSPSTGFSFGSTSSPSSGFVFGSAPGSSPASSSTPIFGSSGASPVFGSTGTSSASTAASIFGSSDASSASTAASVFGSTTASSTSSPFFGSMGASSSTTFSFTAAPVNPTSGPTFSFTSSATASPSPPPVFGSSNSPFTFGSPAPANNNNSDQMSMEDSMAEDTFQANHGSTPPAPAFGQQQTLSPPAGFMFGSNAGAGAGASAGANPFQFGAQENLPTLQSPSPFQASGSLDFNAGGGSFSLGTGGGDKSSRRIISVKKHRQRKK